MVPDPGAEARREVVERYALRDPDGAVVFCREATRCRKRKPAYPDEGHAGRAAAELTPLVDNPLAGYECSSGDHWHLATEWASAVSASPSPFSRYDRVVAALLDVRGGVMTFSEIKKIGQWRKKAAGSKARRAIESLERGGYVLRVDDTVLLTDRDGLLSAHLRKHPKVDHDSDQVGAGS